MSPIIGLYCAEPDNTDPALLSILTQSLQLPLLTTPPEECKPDKFVVIVEGHVVSLCFTGNKAPGPISVDFTQGAYSHRRHFGGGKGQSIAKAVGIKGSRFYPHVVDLTAGLGQDSFVLATLGCHITCVERVPVIFHLLYNGLSRANKSDDDELKQIVDRIELHHQQSLEYLNTLNEPVDVIYLDPMFPEREKSAKVKKSMTAFQSIVGGDMDAGELLSMALEKAKYRVIVKRPRKAPGIDEQWPDLDLPKPGLVLAGKSSRFDIYPLSKMPKSI